MAKSIMGTGGEFASPHTSKAQFFKGGPISNIMNKFQEARQSANAAQADLEARKYEAAARLAGTRHTNKTQLKAEERRGESQVKVEEQRGINAVNKVKAEGAAKRAKSRLKQKNLMGVLDHPRASGRTKVTQGSTTVETTLKPTPKPPVRRAK